jgi:hypothetical protein
MKDFIILLVIFSCGFCNAQNPENVYDIDYDGHLYFELSFTEFEIHGDFVFDTGASNLYLDTLFYRQNDFPDYGTVDGILKGAGTGEKRVDVILSPILFSLNGQKKFKSDTTVLLDLKNRFGEKVDGVFGLNFFRRKAIQINYPKERISFLDSLSHKKVEDYKLIPLITENNKFLTNCEVWLNDSIHLNGKFVIDTGNPNEIVLNSGAIDLKKLRRKAKYKSFGGIGGDSQGYTFLSQKINLNGFEFSNVPTDVSLNQTGALASSDYLGIIGNGLLEKFDVIIAKDKYALFLKRNENFDKGFQKSKRGFSFNDNSDNGKGWIVHTVYLNSNAAKNGLQIRDRILAVNYIPVRYYNGKSPIKGMKAKVKLKIQRAKTIKTIRFRPENIIDKLRP